MTPWCTSLGVAVFQDIPPSRCQPLYILGMALCQPYLHVEGISSGGDEHSSIPRRATDFFLLKTAKPDGFRLVTSSSSSS
ncbi:hypothetical protein QC761_0089390 [Podospora bellae-mahoneyi]|uniref:Uncharacterized protein n=1 Tax=Podospora bellae-mahoneyi TaxID=2093777 RepID=A0ABR0F895_9PEZI|nr:hypothetical protein QC761_0089390 [Podospora bellae-mahoneyi]